MHEALGDRPHLPFHLGQPGSLLSPRLWCEVQIAVRQALYTFCPCGQSQVPVSPGGTEAQRGGVTCSESHSKEEQKPGLNWDKAPGASGSHISWGVAGQWASREPRGGGGLRPPQLRSQCCHRCWVSLGALPTWPLCPKSSHSCLPCPDEPINTLEGIIERWDLQTGESQGQKDFFPRPHPCTPKAQRP